MRPLLLTLILLLGSCDGKTGNQSAPDAPASDPARYLLQPAAVADQGQGATGCALSALASCGNTNQLVHEDDFAVAVANFIGPRRRAYVDHPDGPEGSDMGAPLVSDQVIAVMGGPPDDARKLGPYFFFSACRAHSCPEKGFAVLTPEGEIVALGIFHFWNEQRAKNARSCCGHDPDLTIHYQPTADWQRIEPALKLWAEGKAASLHHFEGEEQPKLRQVELIEVSG
jgi:hypothetical protein